MPPDRGARPLAARAALSLAAALIVAACGGATASVEPSVTPAPTPAPTTAPTPSPTPIDVSAAFVKRMVLPGFSATATLTGTLTIGPVKGDISGTAAFSGNDSSTSMSITAGTYKQDTASVHIGSSSWSRKSPGPWLDDPKQPAGSTDKSLSTILRSLVSVTDLGVETHAGKQLHHLRSTSGNEIPGAAFGLDSASAKDAKFTLDFYATDDGSPAVMAIAGDWTQVSGATSVPTAMTFDIVLSDVGTPQTIAPPADVWVRYTSKDFGYTMAHPADWTVTSSKTEDTYAIDGQGYVYVATQPFKGSTAKFVTALEASYKKQLGQVPKSETPTTLGGQPAVRLLYEYKDKTGQDVTIADDVISRDGTGWEVLMATGGGAADVGVFDQFVSTFAFTE